MNLSDLLTTLWQALRGNIGGGQDYVVVYKCQRICGDRVFAKKRSKVAVIVDVRQ